MFTDNQRTKIIPKKMEITSYYGILNSTYYKDVEYNMFLLGSNRNVGGGGWVDNATDSYNLSTYFTPTNTGSDQSNLVTKETAYSSGGTQNSAFEWWLRSGYVYFNDGAMYVNSTGGVVSDIVYFPYALRPAFVLNLE